MCLAIPVKIMEIEGAMARVELDGVARNVSLALTPEAHLGDYVLIHTGYAISVLEESEALETLSLFEELAAASAAEESSYTDDDTSPAGGATPA